MNNQIGEERGWRGGAVNQTISDSIVIIVIIQYHNNIIIVIKI